MNEWHPLKLDPSSSKNYLFSFSVPPEGNSYTFRLTDGSQLWQEVLPGSKVSRRNKDLNPALEAEPEDLIPEVRETLLLGRGTYFSLGEDMALAAKGRIDGYDFAWRFVLKEADREEFFKVCHAVA